jgi:hypothetical protein
MGDLATNSIILTPSFVKINNYKSWAQETKTQRQHAELISLYHSLRKESRLKEVPNFRIWILNHIWTTTNGMSLWWRDVLITKFTHNLLCMSKKCHVLKLSWNSQEISIHYCRSETDSKSIMTLNMHGSIYIFRDRHTITYTEYIMHIHVHL